jgi:hypothetical protein
MKGSAPSDLTHFLEWNDSILRITDDIDWDGDWRTFQEWPEFGQHQRRLSLTCFFDAHDHRLDNAPGQEKATRSKIFSDRRQTCEYI